MGVNKMELLKEEEEEEEIKEEKKGYEDKDQGTDVEEKKLNEKNEKIEL